MLQHDLLTAHSLIPGFAADEAGGTRAGATRILRSSVENRNGGVHVECTVVDPATHKVVKVESADAASVSLLLPALNSIAKKLDDAAIEYPTKSSQAWQSFSTAETNNNPQQRAQFINQAINHDQNFGLAWVSLMDMISPNRQTDLKHMIDDAKSHRNAFAPYDRAKFDIAIGRLSNAAPADQVKMAQAALALAPNDLDVLTILGNNQIIEGDAAAGEQSLRRATALNPTNIGLRFQLARGLMEMKKFKEAEAVFNTIDKTPAVYPELATCILLEGDKARAATVAEKFVASIQNEELKPMLRAAWDVMAGDRQKGVDLVLSAPFKTPNIRAIALSEATVWQLMGQDYAGAEKTAGLLTQSAGPSIALPQVAILISDKSTPSVEWQAKVQSVGLPDAIKQPILAYGFFLRGNYDDAAKIWQQVNDANHGSDLHARAMLASSLDRAGKPAGKKIAVLPFTPEFADLYSAVSFTEMRRMLAK